MKIIHLPAYKDPYQKSLLFQLQSLGYDVVYGEDKQKFSVVELSLLYNIIKFHKEIRIIHLHWQHPFLLSKSKIGTVVKSSMFTLQMLLLKLLGIKLVWTVHNITNHENVYKDIELFFSKLISKSADAIIVHCETSKCEIIKEFNIPETKITIIPHGNFIGFFKNNLSRNEAREILKISEEDLVFLFLGLIRPYKGVFELIDNFLLLNSKTAKLLIVGKVLDDQLSRRLQDKTAGISNVKLVSEFIPDDNLQLYTNAADVMVFPYRNILNSGSVISAMSFGKPVLCPDMGCIPEVLESRSNFIYDPRDTKGLLNSLRSVVKSKDELHKMGFANREFVKKFNWQCIAATTVRVYKKCLHGSRFD